MKPGHILAFAVASMLLVTGAYAADNKITSQIYTVVATNDEWTQTNIKVSPGDILMVNEGGNKIVVGKFLGSTDANGASNGAGALYMKIGTGAGFKIGAHGYIFVTEPGVAKLKVNDTKYDDNSGSYKVNIIHIPASLIPSAQVVDQ